MGILRTRTTRRSAPRNLKLGVALLLVLVAIAILGPSIWGPEAEQLGSQLHGKPSGEHPLGTDALGRDLLARTLVATRLTMLMGLGAAAIAIVGGLLLGAMIVFTRPLMRTMGERIIDLGIAFPPLLVAIALMGIFRPSPTTIVIAIGVAFLSQFARLTNRLATAVSARDFVVIGRHLGLGRLRLARRHVIPNMAGPLLVLASVCFGAAIAAIGGLSFVGIGVQEPNYDWGRLLQSGMQNLRTHPVEIVGPAVGVLLAGLAAGLVGDGVTAYLDPRRSSVKGPLPTQRLATKPSGGPILDRLNGSIAPTEKDLVVRVRNLTITSEQHPGVPLVHGVSFEIRRGEILGIVGESGSGKSLTAMGIARLLRPDLAWTAAALEVDGMQLADPHSKAPSDLATQIGVVFQDPSSSFNPARRIGAQIAEVARLHGGMSRAEANDAAIQRLRECRVSAPELRMRQYPYELSGGMRQRAMIAGVLLTSPALIIADEPTTALDVTVQAEVLDLLRSINAERRTSILLISHDINVISTTCDRICVMYAGEIVEELTAEALRDRRVCHPYTRALLMASPELLRGSKGVPLNALPGRAPAPGERDAGCAFGPRCSMRRPQCDAAPAVRSLLGGERVACHVTEGPLEMVHDVRI